MFLELINFRCFSKLQLQIPDQGVILLHGVSGTGKTTILKAINFVLFNKEQKIVKYNEKKCSVTLKFKNTIITRTKSPNHLVLEIDNQKYEDDAAQEIINKKYGKYFSITSYVAQKSIESFASLPLNEKMEFFNNLALKDFDIKTLKEKTKEIIKDRKKNLSDKSNEIKILINELNSFQLPEHIEIPSFLHIDTLDDDIHLEKTKKDSIELSLQSFNKLLLNKKNMFKLASQNKNLYLQLKSELNSNLKQIDELILNKKKLEEEIIDDNQSFIKKLKLLIEFLNTSLQVNNIKTNIEKSKNDILFKEQKNLDKIKNKMNSFINKDNLEHLNSIVKLKPQFDLILDLFTEITIQDNLIELLNEKNELSNKNIEQIEEQILLIEKDNFNIKNTIDNLNKIRKCPSCKSSLIINDNTIELFKTKDEYQNTILNQNLLDNKNKIKELFETKKHYLEIKKNLNLISITEKDLNVFWYYFEYINEINSIQNLNQSLKDFQLVLNEEKIIQNRIDNISSNELILSFINKLDKTEKKISELKNECEIQLDLEFINKLNLYEDFKELELQCWNDILDYDENDIIEISNTFLNEMIKIQNQREIILKNIKEIEKKINRIEVDNKDIKSRLESLDIDTYSELENDIQNLEREISEKQLERELFLKRDKEMILYLSYKNEVDRYYKLKERIERSQQEEIEYIKSLNISEKFLKITGNAEALSISNTLTNINNLIKYYINHFFPNGDFDMKLTPYKETVKGDKKSGLDIEIISNGDKIGIDNLSGGEFDRCLLILFLSFNNITNSDIIMLDESLSSLNAELVEEIVDVLKNTIKDKLVLLTLHQANTGIFDYVIDIEKMKN